MPKMVFVVDDEPNIADSLAAILHTAGYETAAFYSARTALEACSLSTPDFLVSDVIMPDMNGVELAAEVKRRFPACRIVLVSGSATTFGLLDGSSQPRHDFELLLKPVPPGDILAALRRAGKRQPPRSVRHSPDASEWTPRGLSRESDW